jgi:SAM-dependent methyltransferase
MSNPWDVRYGMPEFYYGTGPNDFLKENGHHIRPGGTVLCLAEGEGRNAVFLASRDFDVLGVDSSKVGLEKAQALAQNAGVKIRTEVADLETYFMAPESFDAVVSIWCHVSHTWRPELHQRVIQALRPGGVFILEAYRPEQLDYRTGGPPTAELMMTLADLRDELKDLELVVAQEIVRDIQEGKGHSGKSAVVQVIGVKK